MAVRERREKGEGEEETRKAEGGVRKFFHVNSVIFLNSHTIHEPPP